jgi:hypothetical protein
MGINNYNYEWTRVFHTLFSQNVTELGDLCYPKLCPKMTAGKDWECKCMNHGSMKNLNCCSLDYCIHTLDTNSVLLTSPIYFSDRHHIRDHSTQAFPAIIRYIYRMLAHIYYHHRKLFDLLEYRYRIGERLILYCKNLIQSIILKNIVLKYKILLWIIFFYFPKKMMSEYIVPGTLSKQINENIENDPNIKEGNEDYFVYPQNLYTLLLQKKDVNIEFINP